MKATLLTIGLLLANAQLVRSQTLVEQDLAYGLIIHNQIASTSQILPDDEVVPVLKSVFQRLSNTSIVQSAPLPKQTLFYVHSGIANAAAGAGGRLYVHDGLLPATGVDPGVLAFVIGHELAHNVLQHGIKKYLRSLIHENQVAAFRYQMNRGDQRASWELLAYLAADKVASAKTERDEENDADQLGLMIATEGGYHPAFAIVAARRMRQRLGEQSKFGAFISDHPRWTTREERAEQNYDAALARFAALWPSAANSPGGPAPLLISSKELSVTKAKGGYTVAAHFTVRNASSDEQLFVRIVEDGEHGVPSVVESRALRGDESGQISASLADEFFKSRKGHQWASVRFETGNGSIVYETQSKTIK